MTNHEDMRTGDALLIIDLQKDFCKGGELAVKDADDVVPVVNVWIERALHGGVPVIASRDWHPLGHVSFVAQGGDWPPHCIQDSAGAAFHRDLRLPGEAVIVTKGVRFDKDQNSAFDDTGLEIYLKKKGIDRLFVCGLALDVCVLATVMDALRVGFQVFLIRGGTKPVDEKGGQSALGKMKTAGAKVADSEDEERKPYDKSPASSGEEAEPPVCTKAPEWAEHQRFDDDDQPCDDGRSGNIDR